MDIKEDVDSSKAPHQDQDVIDVLCKLVDCNNDPVILASSVEDMKKIAL